MLPMFLRAGVVEEEAILGRVVSAVSVVVRLILLCVLLRRVWAVGGLL